MRSRTVHEELGPGVTHTECWSDAYRADGARYPVVCLHGRGSNSAQFTAPRYVDHVTDALAGTGRLVLSIDAGGPYNWGGPASQSEIRGAIELAVRLGAKPGGVVLVGLSMGCLGALKYLKDEPGTVKATVLMLPVVDLTRHHDRPTGAADAAEIEAAHGGPAGYRANVGAYDPAASPASFTGLPIKAWYADDDVRATASWFAAFRSAVGGDAFQAQSLGPVGHNPQSVDARQVAAFVTACVAGS